MATDQHQALPADRTWICFDAPQNQACLRLSDFARMDASSELCENSFQKKSQHRIPCPEKLQPAPTTVPQNAFESAQVCDEEDCSQGGRSVAPTQFLNQAVEAREFVQSGAPLIAAAGSERGTRRRSSSCRLRRRGRGGLPRC